jgi:hypothetical protein
LRAALFLLALVHPAMEAEMGFKVGFERFAATAAFVLVAAVVFGAF